MKTRTKALLLALCAVVLVAASVFGTMAYLTDTDEVTNTFTVGNVKITLDEAKVETDGTVVEGADRVKKNEYHLLPGHTYVKDPTIHVDANSEACWLFVKVNNGLEDIEYNRLVTGNIEDQMMSMNGSREAWLEIDAANGIYAYPVAVSAGESVFVFKQFRVAGDITNEKLAEYADAEIVVTAYAVQKDGFDTAQAAWNATFGANP